MTDPRILEVKEGLGITECPKCHSKKLIVHRDLAQRIDMEKDEVTPIRSCQHDFSKTPYKITNIRCGKCGQLVGGVQDLVIFGSAIHTLLKEELEREPTTEEFLNFWNYLDVDIPQWLRDNIKAFGRD